MANWTVNAVIDTGSGSGNSGDLRYCMTNAGSGDSIFAGALLEGTILLGSALPQITQSLTIDFSTGLGPIAVDGANLYQPFFVNAVGGTVTFNALTVQNGNDTSNGGGACCFKDGTLNITNCSFIDNTSSYQGGVIAQLGGTLNITNCTFFGNSDTGNTASVLVAEGVSTTLTNCTLCSNIVGFTGPAAVCIVVYPGVSFLNCIIYDNTIGPDGPIIGPSSPTVAYCCVQGGYSGTGNIDTDPSVAGFAFNDGTASTTTFVWDHENAVQEFESDDSVVYYTEHPGASGGLISRREGSTTQFYIYDQSNKTRFLANSSGEISESYVYDAFGNLINSIKYGVLTSPMQVPGMDPTFGGVFSLVLGDLHLYGKQHGYQSDLAAKDVRRLYVRARHFDTETAKWMSRDPFGDVDGPNRYGYCGNDGVNRTDPSGNTPAEAKQRVFTLRSKIIEVARAHNIPPDLLAGVVFVEENAGGYIHDGNDISRLASMAKFALIGKGDAGITKFHHFSRDVPGINSHRGLGRIAARAKWIYRYNKDTSANLNDAASFLSRLALRRWRRTQELSKYQISIVLTDYNEKPKPLHPHPKPSSYGRTYLKYHDTIMTMLYNPVRAQDILDHDEPLSTHAWRADREGTVPYLIRHGDPLIRFDLNYLLPIGRSGG